MPPGPTRVHRRWPGARSRSTSAVRSATRPIKSVLGTGGSSRSRVAFELLARRQERELDGVVAAPGEADEAKLLLRRQRELLGQARCELP